MLFKYGKRIGEIFRYIAFYYKLILVSYIFRVCFNKSLFQSRLLDMG